MEQEETNIVQEVDVKSELIVIKEELKRISEQINILVQISSRMDNHVTFIEEVYTSLRAPLNFVKRKVNYLTGNNKDLPLLSNDVLK